MCKNADVIFFLSFFLRLCLLLSTTPISTVLPKFPLSIPFPVLLFVLPYFSLPAAAAFRSHFAYFSYLSFQFQ